MLRLIVLHANIILSPVKHFFALVLFHSFFEVVCAQQFTDMTAAWNVNHTFDGTNYGSGATIYDWNDDGLDDLVLCRFNQPPMFLVNNGNGFSQVPPPLPAFSNAKHLTFADYDNDGDPDIFVTVYNAHPRMYRNEGNFYFTEVTLQAGISLTAVLSFGHSWGDYDLDGDLDLYVCNYNGPGFPNPTFTNQFYKNNGNGTFTEAAVSTGIDNGSWYTFMATWVDINNDYVPDLYVTNDRYTARNYMYKNIGGGEFEEIAESAGLDQYIFSMCATQGDVQNDGYQDFYVTNGTDGNLLLLNNGDETYDEVAGPMGVELNTFNWGSNLIDFDNDTWVDLYVNSSSHITLPGLNRFFKGMEGEFFMEMSSEAGFDQSIEANFFNHSSAVGDFNNDGLYDIASTRQSPGTSRVFLNTTETENNYIKVTLEGVNANRDGIGSWIKAYANGQEYSRYTAAGEGYLSQNSQHIIIGIGSAEVVDSLKVIWPGGYTDCHYELVPNASYHALEGFSLNASITTTDGLAGFCPGGSLLLSCEQEGVSYLWSTGDTTQTITAAEPGFYSVTIAHPFGFSSLAEFEVELWATPEFQSSVTDVVCFGEGNGTASVVPTGNFGQIIWTTGDVSLSIVGLDPGVYGFELISEEGCSTTGEIEVLTPEPLLFSFELTAEPDSPECPLTWSGQTNVLEGGTEAYSVTWTFNLLDELGNVLSTDELTDEWTWNCQSGPMDVLVQLTDANGCFVSDSVRVVGLVGINELMALVPMVFPNPASTHVTVSSPNYFDAIQMLSLDGKLLVMQSFDRTYMKTFELPEEANEFVVLQLRQPDGTWWSTKIRVLKD